MTEVEKDRSGRGLEFFLPEAMQNKTVSTIEVGPSIESGLAEEINRFLRTDIKLLNRVDTYLLVHDSNLHGLDTLLHGKPFIDPIIHQATLNQSLALKLGLPFDYVLQSMLNPGTSDAEGDTALKQVLLALRHPLIEEDQGFYSAQYFLKGNLNREQLEEVSGFLANPDLHTRLILPRSRYEEGVKVQSPVVVLKPETEVINYDVVNMSDNELIQLSSKRKLAATLEEMKQFRDIYKDAKFLDERKKHGLDNKATDVELEVWFGLRSEHCFHKELNAQVTIEDKVNDPIFKRAYEKGWLTKTDSGYILEDGLFKTFIERPALEIHKKLEKRGNNWIADMFVDNAGTVFYDDDFMFCIKYETHNSPSNKEPIQGAKTGIDGVNRDIFGNMKGTFDAISNFFHYCTGDPHYEGWLPKGVKHPYTILKGVTQGVREGGNESQIPTLGGGITTDPRYIAKCLVYCGTVGWSPVRSSEGISYLGKAAIVGDRLIVAGQPVGIDGVHGATESSLSASANISLGHVQADFSFIQAKMKGFILESAKDNLFSSIGDCGAMGISVALELAKETNGLEMDLSLHPIKYKGIQPWQVACAETQDRMVPVVNPENKEEVFKRAKIHDVQVTDLGSLTDSGYANLKWGNETVALIDLEKLSNKEPRKKMHATWKGSAEQKEVAIKGEYSLEDSLCLVMSQPDVASKEWFFRQKDPSVKGGTIQGPLIGINQDVEADATIQEPPNTEGRDYGAIAYALGISPKVSDIDAYHSSQKSFIDMVGKIIAVGGALPDMDNAKWDAWAVCGNYCQPNSDSNSTLSKENGEHNLASFVREGMGVAEAEEATNVPVISGKDSMKCSCKYEVDESFKLEDVPADLRKHITLIDEGGKKQIEIHDPDSYLASCAVKIEDYRKCVNSAFKQEGDLIYVVGTTKNHLGASQYLNAVGYKENGAPIVGGNCPETDLKEFVDVAKAVHSVIDSEFVASCSYIHNGGLITAVSKAAMAGTKGADINSKNICNDRSCKDDEQLLYSETPGRFIVSVAPEDLENFEKTIGSVPYAKIGEVTENVSGRIDENILGVSRINDFYEKIHLPTIKQNYQKPLSFGLNVLVA